MSERRHSPRPPLDAAEALGTWARSAGGPEERPGGNQPIPLTDDGVLFLVEGRLELFFERPGEPRLHGATFGPGSLLFGFGDLPDDGTPRPVAVPQPGARLHRLELPALLDACVTDADGLRSGVEHALIHWIDTLTARLVRLLPAGRGAAADPVLGPGATPEGAPGQALCADATESLVWVRHRSGSSRFLGLAPEGGPAPLRAQDAFFPLPPSGWIEPEEASSFDVVAPHRMAMVDDLAPALPAFHGRLAAAFGQAARLDGENRHRRLRRSAGHRRDILADAYHRLASVLDRRPSRAGGTGASEALLEACRSAGEGLGLEFRPAPDGETIARAHPHHRLDRLCRASRVRWRQVALEDGWWQQDVGPLLAFRFDRSAAGGAPEQQTGTPPDNPEPPPGASAAGPPGVGEPVAVLPVGPCRFELYDPEDGRRTPIDEEVEQSLHPVAFTFYRPLPEGPVGVKDLLRLMLLGQSRDLWTLAGCGFLAGALALLIPLFTDRIFGYVLENSDRGQLAQIVLALAAAAMASAAFYLTRSFAMLRLTGRLDGMMQPAIIDRLLDLPTDLYRSYSKGDLAVRALGIDRIRNLLLGQIMTAAMSVVFSVISLIILFFYSLRLAFAGMAMVALLLLVVTITGALQVPHLRRFYAHQGAIASLLFNVLQAVSKLRVAGSETHAYVEWARRFAAQRRESVAAQRLAIYRQVFAAAYPVLTTLVLFAVMGLSVRGSLPTSDFLAFSAAFGQFQAAALTLVPLITGLLSVIPVYERLRPILMASPEVETARAEAPELRGDIEMSHVTFRYGNEGPKILDDVSIRIAPGEMVALVGPSGGGKSTCLRLLLGFETPDQGSIYYDGHDISRLDIQSVRRQLGVVLQDGKPFPGSLYRNIIGSHVHLGHEAAWEAARLADLEDDIRAMPMGMHTVLSENASTLSGGQRQRLMIARAVVGKPPILLFDEATSSLDNLSQQKVNRAVERLRASRLVLAHRLSTVRRADRIYVLDGGKVAESGTFDELMAARGVFYRLARRQIAR